MAELRSYNAFHNFCDMPHGKMIPVLNLSRGTSFVSGTMRLILNQVTVLLTHFYHLKLILFCFFLVIPSPLSYGWNLVDDKFVLNWFDGDMVPRSLDDIMEPPHEASDDEDEGGQESSCEEDSENEKE